MKKFLVILAILMLVSSISFAQEVTPGPAAGNKGMLFLFDGLANLRANSYNGGLGAKLFLSDYMAVRAVICLSMQSTKTPASPGVNQIGADGETSDNTIGFGGAVELHLSKARISPYIGGSIMFATRSTESKAAVVQATGTTINQTTVKNANGATSFTLGAILGAEYFVTNGVSLSAEYQLGFTSSSEKDQESTTANVTTTVKGGSASTIGISAAGILTLAVYF